MKSFNLKLYISIIFLITITILTQNSCNEDFDLTEPWKDIPIVYAAFNRSDTAQYVRLEKAFVSENLAATELAMNPDSLYYKNAIVKVINKTANKEYILTKVDAALDNYQRRPGDFATNPNYMYKIRTKDMTLKGGDLLIVEVDRGDNSKKVTSSITMMRDVKLYEFDTSFRQLNFDPKQAQSFSWIPGPDAKVFSFRMFVNVEEYNTVTAKLEYKLLTVEMLINGVETNYLLNGKSFFELIKNSLQVDPQLRRTISYIVLELKSGSSELRNYLNVVNANTGLTASQEIPRYTNISEGFGLVFSTSVWRKSYTIGSETILKLRSDESTKNLNF